MAHDFTSPRDHLPVNSLAGRPGIGHNQPPLAERLSDELSGDKTRAAALLEAAAAAKIATQGDAERVADLIALIRASEKAIDRIREDFKRPLMADSRMIDATCGGIVGPLTRAREALKAMLDEWLPTHREISPSVAQVGSRRKIEFVIEDLPAAIGWLLQNRGGELAQAVRTIIGKHVASLGVDHATEANIPGVTVTITAITQVR